LKTSVNEFNNETILNISDFVEGQNLDFEKYNFDSKAYLFRFKSEVDMELFFSRIEILAKQGMFESEKHKELFFEAVVKYINLKKEIIVEENNIYFNMEDHIKNNIDFLILLTKAEKDNIYDILLKTYTQSKGLLLNKNKVSFEDTIKSDASKELIKVPSPQEEL
jgi:hypothetical protein